MYQPLAFKVMERFFRVGFVLKEDIIKRQFNCTATGFWVNKSREAKIEVRMENETVWLSQKQMAELFDCSVDNVGLHLKNIFKESELSENSVTEEYSVTASDGKNYLVKHYNLDAIISVGYRINSLRGTQFRKWATARLREYLVQGFTMNDEFLKNNGGGLYWKKLLARIRDIRSSEKMLYRQVLDLYVASVDYDPKNTKSFKLKRFLLLKKRIWKTLNCWEKR